MSKVVSSSAGFPPGGRIGKGAGGEEPQQAAVELQEMLAAESIGDLRAVQSRTPLLQLRGKVLAEHLAVGIPFCLGDKRPSEDPKERRRNTTSLGSGASAVSTASSSLLKGWAELARVEALTVDTLGYSSQAPPSCGLIPFLSSQLWIQIPDTFLASFLSIPIPSLPLSYNF